MNKSGIKAMFILALLTIPLYIYTYKYGIGLFWVIFILDRIISTILEFKFSKSFDVVSLKTEDDIGGFTVSKFFVMIVLFCIIGIGMILYILFKYPKLFIVLMIGKAIDKVIGKIIKKTTKSYD